MNRIQNLVASTDQERQQFSKLMHCSGLCLSSRCDGMLMMKKHAWLACSPTGWCLDRV